MDYPVEIIRSRRRTLVLSVEEGPRVLVKAPYGMSGAAVEEFVQRHRRWIERRLLLLEERRKNAVTYSLQEIAAFRVQAAQAASDGIARFAPRMGVAPSGVKITSAVKRWGSCSAKNSLCFSWRIALLPPEAADYIVVHELAHIRQKNHGPRFYAEVAAVLPDYRERIAVLRQAERRLGL